MHKDVSFLTGLAIAGCLLFNAGTARADDDRSRVSRRAVACGVARGARGGPRPAERRIQPGDVGERRQSRRRGVRGRVHRQSARRSVARQPGDLGAEGEHGERVQSARARAFHGEPLHRDAAGRQPVRVAGEQPGRHRRRVRRQPGEQRPEQRSDGRIPNRRRECIRRRTRALRCERKDRGRRSAPAATRRARITTSPGGRVTR